MDDAPEWAIENALATFRARHVNAKWTAADIIKPEKATAGFRAIVLRLARYIAAHEEPPVDPLLVEARAISAAAIEEAKRRTGTYWCDPQEYLDGKKDDAPSTIACLAALRRGIELAKETTHAE